MQPPEDTIAIACVVNGRATAALVPVRQSLVDWLREGVGLTGSHVGCAHGVCGACHVVMDGVVVRGCLMLAAQVDGATISTIEHAETDPVGRALQQAFFDRAALQCGFCTPGMILQAAELLRATPNPTRMEIRETLSGNLCRCTGYQAIIDAVETAAATLRAVP
jgi:aerobic-type carbon monoxide dehydrogenase small subunit (CoxS/CutS family)